MLIALELAQHTIARYRWRLLVAVGSGTLAGLLDPNGISMLPMTVLPLSLAPTFLVPLFLIFHVISIAQAQVGPAGRHGPLCTLAWVFGG